MASILTNINAMSALQTLRSISSSMEDTQSRISTGQRVSSASDNAAYWSIATTMRSDNAALSSVQDAMGLGAAKVDTASSGLESSINVIKEIKNKLITAQESTADKSKIQEEITQLQDQLKSITDSASFSGENWLKGVIGKAAATAGDLATGVTINKQIVGSFTRNSEGNVKVQSIDVALDGSNVLVDISGNKQGILDSNALRADVAKWTDDKFYTATTTLANTFSEGANGVWSDGTDFYKQVGENKWLQTTDATGATLGGTPAEQTTIATVYAANTSVLNLDITKLDTMKTAFGLGATATSEDVLDQLISHVDGQLEAATSAAAKLGAVSSRLDMQQNFVSKLSDSLESGIGRLVDADMNEESTKLKALQTQQQLAIQSLSIANSDSQNILSLFR
ncbi:flagellin [Rhizobium oryzihabitans]|jgi:flagellin|uniref:Flagellin n=1 Tax=Rhizobium oryzihabitans TaxID=2267833 RepID=A0A7L5BGW3_9HYPH|nr:flagellin [Rhizobium oryzihabitans]EGP58856.1 flagellin domain-containing protein [Agrobacterium tumefaciens F2]QCM04002.1 flagellin [Agrobacterium tumefaciens]CUX42365.1 Flagellin A [Agrobacterium genomosp. 5 str. CFBP 6626]QIB38006.1 flagellin [Rhizobium oryzihabitans]WKL20240.1 flagellin [Agrobacterium tumefaciens]